MEPIDIPGKEAVDSMSSPEAESRHTMEMTAGVNPTHPFSDKTHPQHNEFVDYMSRLNERSLADADLRPQAEIKTEAIMERTAEHQQQEQTIIVQSAQENMDALVELGFERADVPPDLLPYQAEGLKIQRMAAEGKYDEFVRAIDKQAQEHRTFGIPTSDDVVRAIGTLLFDGGLDDSAKKEIADFAARKMYDSNEALQQLKKEKGLL